MIDDYFDTVIALTSIGLDGEEIDQVTFQEKPRIFANRNHLIATAKGALKYFEAEYEILSETDIKTAIGPVQIVRIKKAGNVLVAGPAKVSDMKRLVFLLNEYKPDKIFIDGAFFRHSTARISQVTIFVVGANYSADIDKVVKNAKLMIKKFQLKEFENKSLFTGKKNIRLIDKDDQMIDLDLTSVIGNKFEILNERFQECKTLYLPKALTNDFVLTLIKKRKIYDFDIVINSPVNIQLSENVLENFLKLKRNIYVLEPVDLVAVCYNPSSSRGYEFDDVEFKDRLSKITDLNVINVNKDV